MVMHIVVAIIGAGPAGLATAACLNRFSIPNLIFERENCTASLWKNRAYDRLKLHISKEFCNLPYKPFSPNSPMFVPRAEFVEYLDDYAVRFNVETRFNRSIEEASYNESINKWFIRVTNTESGRVEVYFAKYLVVATGENSEGVVPDVPGLDRFEGKWAHSNDYVNGLGFEGKDVLVVGGGNSAMEIAYDLSNFGARTSIANRSPVHILSKEMVYIGMKLLKYFRCSIVDRLVVVLSILKYGDLSKYGIQMPKQGPFFLKQLTGRSPTIEVGTIDMIKQGKIKVFPTTIKTIKGCNISFSNGQVSRFDAIIFATGYKSTVRNWLDGGNDLFNQDGMPKPSFPNHWKGANGLYCVGFARRGLAGISSDALKVANDIKLEMVIDD